MKKVIRISGLAMASAALVAAGCGGGGDDTTSVDGTVVDGYLAGATVCVDVNGNGACDSGEPVSSASGSDGKFTIKGVKKADAAAAPLVAVVPQTATDSDTGAAVGAAYQLMAPAGKTVVSPLTTLVQQAMLKNSSLTADTAAAAVKSAIGSLASTDLFADYVASGDANAHAAAQVLAHSLMANFARAQAVAGGESKNLAITVVEVAKQALQSQGSTPDSSLPVGVEDSNTLRASIAALTPRSATQDVTISFDLVNGSSPVRCGDAISVANTALWDHATDTLLATPVAQNTSGKLVDTRFYISNVMLLDASGNAVPLAMTDNGTAEAAAGVALLDFGYVSGAACTTSYTTTLSGKVPAGSYTGVSMTLGVPIRTADFSTRLNHTNTADTNTPSPLQVTATSWTWQSGRKFTKIEFQPDTAIDKIGASTTAKWYVHLGSTGCAGDPTVNGNETACTNPNRLDLQFDSFNAATQKVVLDIAQLFKSADLTFDGGGAAGCMSGSTDPECAPIFKSLGLDLQTGRVLTGAAQQTVFSVR
jgi:uncharacterized repeat protein (TIGR04052 family)